MTGNADRTNATGDGGSPRHHRRIDAQVLEPSVASARLEIGRAAAPRLVDRLVDYLWWVAWDEPEPRVQAVIPRPVVHVAAEPWNGAPKLVVTGVQRRRFERRLEGVGRTIAIAFRPGGFRPFIVGDVSELTDRRLPLSDILEADDRDIAARLLDLDVPPDIAMELLAEWFVSLGPPQPDATSQEIATLVERSEVDPEITRVGHLADLAGVSQRTLQRRFRTYVGVGPKWVIQLFRLLDVSTAAHRRDVIDWAGLAVELGYSDQSHLIRHFKRLVGEPPATYVARA